MLKKRKIITVLILILLFAFLCIIYFVNSFNVNLKGGKLLIYSSIKLSQEDIFHINTNRYDILDHSSYFDDIWEIRKNSDGSYGYLFELDYHFDLSRYIKMNDYIVEATIDYSNLDDSEKIFFSESSGGLHDQYVFIRRMILLMAILGMCCFFVVVNIHVQNIFEFDYRKSEFQLLQIIGISKKKKYAIVILETTYVFLLGMIGGLVLCKVIGGILYNLSILYTNNMSNDFIVCVCAIIVTFMIFSICLTCKTMKSES